MQCVRARKFLNDHLSREVAGLVRKRLMPTGGQGRWAEGGTRATGPRLLRGRQRRCTSAIEMGRRGPCSTDIARSSVWRLLTLCHDAGRDTTVHAHTVRVDHASPTSARIAAGPGNPVDHGNRVRRLVDRSEGDRTVPLVGRPGRTTGTAAPTSPAQDRRSNNGNPGNLWQNGSMISRPFIDKNSEKSIALSDVPDTVQRGISGSHIRGRYDASQPDR